MGASSVTGAGQGASDAPTLRELSKGPRVMLTGVAYSRDNDLVSSPYTNNSVVTFQRPLPGPASSYCVFLTNKNGGVAYLTDMTEDADGNFNGFTVISEAECEVMYMVTTIGSAQ